MRIISHGCSRKLQSFPTASNTFRKFTSQKLFDDYHRNYWLAARISSTVSAWCACEGQFPRYGHPWRVRIAQPSMIYCK